MSLKRQLPGTGGRQYRKSNIGYLLEEIRQVKPEIVVLIGKIARKTPRLKAIEYIETYHPSAAMRFPKVREKFESDFEKLRKEVSSPISKAERQTRNNTHTRYSH